MARNSMTFNASLRLNSAGFKKGVAEVKSALAGLKSTFLSLAGALGAGLGFTQFISSMKDTAVQLSVAQNVLKNVSKVTKEYTDGVNKGTIELNNYAENLAYVRKLAKDYSQDLIGLTENFAKFHAACDKTNLSLEQQKDVFEALTRAAAYYHMSADQTNDMTLAVTQMMSKGKVTSEELRRQLGNSLPGAFNLMAAAIGVTTAQLEDMMKKGEVISSEALPRFAAMLNQVTKIADFDSLQMSINRLKNTWTDFVEKSGAENVFKGIVNGANATLTAITNNINVIKAGLKGIAAGILAFSGFKWLTKQGDKYVADTEKQLKQLKKAQEKTMYQIYGKGGGEDSVGFKPGIITKITKSAPGGKEQYYEASELKLIREYNDTLIKIAKNRRDLLLPMSQEFKEQQEIIKQGKAINYEITKQIGLTKTSAQSVTVLQRAWAGVVSTVKSIGAALKANAIMVAVGAIMGAISATVTYVKKIRDEWKRVNSIVSDYENYIKLSNKSAEENALLLQKNLKIMEDESKNAVVRANALKEINKLMGTSYTTDALDKTKKAYQDIIEEVERWIEATKKQAKIQVLASKAAEAEIEIEKINIRQGELKKEREKLSKGLFTGFKLGKIEIEESINKKAIEEYQEVLKLANKELDELQVQWLELVDNTKKDLGGGGGESDISKVFDKYNEELKELDNKLKEHAITQEEYNEDFDKLVTKFWEDAAGTGKYSIDAILNKIDNGKTLTKLEQWYKDLYDAAQRAAIHNTESAIRAAIEKSIEDAVDEADRKFDEEFKKWAEKAERVSRANVEALTTNKPERTKRDTTFDYGKTNSTIIGEDLDNAKDHVKALEDAIDSIVSKYDNLEEASEAVKKQLAKWKDELALAKKEASTLEGAMNLAKIQEDIDELNKSIDDAVYGGIKNMASSLDRVVKGMESIRTTFEDSDSTGWEQFMVIFNELVQIIDTIISAYKTLQVVEQATSQLANAEISLETTKVALLEEQLRLRRAIAAEKAKEIKDTATQIALDSAEAAASTAAASANAGEAVAGATASGAKLPFPYNLAAIAAGVAAVLAALASMTKFANGGIVGGNSYSGDKQIARVNSGEMVINRHDQATLFKAIKSGNLGSGNVQFKIRGTDLVGVLNNEARTRRG